MKTNVYGITNCTTVQKARSWLESNNVEYIFHDYKKLGIDEKHLQKWCDEIGWERVLNRSGMMWRRATEIDKSKVVDAASAISFMLLVPTSIKRPIIETNTVLLCGYDVKEYSRVLL
jgi:arsenate reductase (glutaredoxin)